MKPDNLIVAMDFTDMDKRLCSYVDFLAQHLHIKHVNNLFVFTAKRMFNAMQRNTGNRGGDLMLKAFGRNMHKRFDSCYPHVEKVKNHALAGLFVEMFYYQYDKTDTDFVVLGKKKGSEGIMSKYITRHVPTNTFIIPEESKNAISNVTIALDHSDFSKRILHNALDFCSLITPKPDITCIHVSHLPYYPELGDAVVESYKQFGALDVNSVNDDFFEEQKKRFEDFIIINSGNYNFKINIKTIFETRPKPFYAVKEYISDENPDLIIMGTRSHSAFDVFLLGSFVEKVISINDKVPMLIVK